MARQRSRRRRPEISRSEVTRLSQQDVIDLMAQQSYLGNYSMVYTAGGRKTEKVPNSYAAYAETAYCSSSVVGAVMRVRRDIFRQARFTWREITEDGTGTLMHNDALSVLETPWPNGTTGELLVKMITDVDLCGNSFIVNEETRLRWRRPDWMYLVLSGDPEVDVDVDVIGYVYTPGGCDIRDGTPYLPEKVCHWSPIPAWGSQYIGQSWMVSALKDIQADKAATDHKLSFFRNGATLGPIFVLPPTMTPEQFRKFRIANDEAHVGTDNAYKPLYVGGGASVTMSASTFQQLELKATQGAGEPLAIDTPIPTPTGWSTMGDLQVGDQVIGRDGQPAKVVGVSPVHQDRECFRITLKDRTSIVADAAHMWAAVDRNTLARAEGVYTTRELFDLFSKPYSNGVGGHRLSLPGTPVVELKPLDQLVDPYVLGAWLGDGQTAGAAICGAEDDLGLIADEIEARGYTVTRWATAPDKVPVIGIPGGLLAALRALGVLGNKHIPTAYLRGSVEQRLDLLRGLMDTDGCALNKGGGCEYSSKFEHLARQVADLLRSLGYRASVYWCDEPRSRTGRSWRVHFRAEQDRIPFLLPRKAQRCIDAGDPHISNRRSIVSIEPVESVPVRCIAVDTADHLFLAGEGFVPTHNTRIASLAGVHPAIAGLSEGLSGSSLNAGNFTAARRITSDITMMPLWQDACAALSTFVQIPDGYELWIRESMIPFLREDAKDAADIASVNAQMITSLVREGYEPKSAQRYAITRNPLDLKHSGLMSVQLQPPVEDQPDPEADGIAAGIDEFLGGGGEATRARFNPADHPRNPKGSAGGGRFRSVAQRVVDALQEWVRTDRKGDPFEGFVDREPLRKVATARGIKLRRGASRDEIAEALKADLLEHLDGDESPSPVKKAAKKAAPKAPDKPSPAKKADVSAQMSPRQREIDGAIRKAYRDLVGRTDLPRPTGQLGDMHDGFRESGWVSIAEIRDALGEKYNRHEVDDVLKRLVVGEDAPARAIPQAARHGLMQRDHDAALRLGDSDSHWFRLVAPDKPDLDSLRELDDPEALRDALDLRKVPELKQMLREEKLPLSGRKRDLVDRLVEHIHGGDEKPAPKKADDADSLASRPIADIRAVARELGIRIPATMRDREAMAEHVTNHLRAFGSGNLDPADEVAQALAEIDARKAPTADKPKTPRASKDTRPFPSGGEPMTEDQARARQADMDARRPAAEVLADVQELIHNGASPRVLKHRITTGAAVSGLSDEERDRLIAAIDADVDNRVRAAYAALPKAPGGWVGLADLRAELGDLDRTEADAALTRLARQKGVRVAPFDNTRALRPQDRAAALALGDSPKHMIAMGDPSPVPGLSEVIDDLAKKAGLTQLGEPGAVVKFDRTKHSPLGKLNDGDSVLVMSPGYSMTLSNGETVTAMRPKVIEADTPPRAQPARPVVTQEGEAALAAPPRNLTALTESSDPRADSLWYRSGDNSLETKTGRPGAFDMADQLRSRKLDPEMKARVKAIDSVMAESRLPGPILVYRGFEPSQITRRTDLVGLEFTDRSFVSTSTDAEHAAGFGGTVMRITVPEGISAVRMADRPGHEQESEVLLDRGLRYRVVRQYDPGELGNTTMGRGRVLDVEVIPNG